MTEGELLRWLRDRDPRLGPRLSNDGATLPPSTSPCALTTDQQIEGVHFLPGLDPQVLAWRLLAVNLSDIAAMGSRPRHALLNVAAPSAFPYQDFFRAFLGACRHFGVELIGGDLATTAKVHLSLTLLGTQDPGGHSLERRTAEPGDRLWVGGTLGLAAAGLELQRRGAQWNGKSVELPEGLPEPVAPIARRAVLRHLFPQPQIALGTWLARQPRCTALDISDGLLKDCHRLCDESGRGARIVTERLPYPPHLAELATHLKVDLHSWMYHGGEDYILLFALPAACQPGTTLRCTEIGEILEGSKRLLKTDGVEIPFPEGGLDHLQKEKSPRDR